MIFIVPCVTMTVISFSLAEENEIDESLLGMCFEQKVMTRI